MSDHRLSKELMEWISQSLLLWGTDRSNNAILSDT